MTTEETTQESRSVEKNTKTDTTPITSLISIDYKEIIDTMSEGIWIGDKDEKTLYMNANFLSAIGYTSEEIIGKESYIFCDEESIKTVRDNNHLRLQGEKSRYEIYLKHKDGSNIPVLISGTPLRNGGTAGIMTDLREIRAVREQAEHYRELNKIKDDFISMVGHELRTPMTGIRGYLSMILDGDAGDITPDTEEYLQVVFKESERLTNLINDMLDIAKLESGKMDFVDTRIHPAIILSEVCDGLKFLASERGILLVCDIDETAATKHILADAAKLKQVLINIAGNALKFTPVGGRVTLRLTIDAGNLLFEVIDTGVGIPKSAQKKIFEKFGQVCNTFQKSVEGTGLGLYICRRILEHFGSSLAVESEEGKGSNFHFCIRYL